MSKITQSARGETCTLRLEDCCNFNPETTVFAHTGKHGTAKRKHDNEGLYACSDCHSAIDFRTRYFLSDDEDDQRKMHIVRDFKIRRAMAETRRRLIARGYLAA